MKNLVFGAIALMSTLAGAGVVAPPADAAGVAGARRLPTLHASASAGFRGRGDVGRGPAAGGAVAAGLTGLAVGAAMARRAHYSGPNYLNGPPPAYYVGSHYYGWYGGCHREWVWTGYVYRLVSACN